MTGSFLRHVADLTLLDGFVLRWSGIDDRRLAGLNRLPGIRALMLDDTKVTDAGLDHFRGLPGLLELDLSRTAVADRGLRLVRGWFPLAVVRPSVPS